VSLGYGASMRIGEKGTENGGGGARLSEWRGGMSFAAPTSPISLPPRHTALFSLVLLLLLPALAVAQRPGIGSLGKRGGTPGIKREPGIEVAPPVNIVNLVIEHRQDLMLSDTVFRRVVSIKRTLDSTNSPLLRRIDSVQRLFKSAPIFSAPSPAHRDSLNAGRALVKEMSADIDDNIADAKDKVFTLLTAPQKEKAEQIEDQARKASATAGRGRL